MSVNEKDNKSDTRRTSKSGKNGTSKSSKHHRNREVSIEMSAYAEMCELAQRKFMQQVAQTATTLKGKRNEFHAPYPRLCFVDLTEKALERLNKNVNQQQPGTAEAPLSQHPTNGNASVRVDFSLVTAGDLVMKVMCEVDGVGLKGEGRESP
jgi:primase-polymerase (primpol)-like protein